MADLALSFSFLLGCLLVLVLAQRLEPDPTARRVARALLDYTRRHLLAESPVSATALGPQSPEPTEAPRLAELIALGFRLEGDLAESGGRHEFERVALGHAGTVVALVYCERHRPWPWAAERVDASADLELRTELQDGSFVVTSTHTTAHAFLTPRALEMEAASSSLDAQTLLSIHCSRVEARARDGDRALAIHDLGEVAASTRRLRALRAEHRRELGGGLTRDELQRLHPDGFAESGQEIYAEIQTLLAQERGEGEAIRGRGWPLQVATALLAAPLLLFLALPDQVEREAVPEDSRPPAESPCEEAEGEDCTDDAGAEIRGRSDTSTPPASPEPERAATPAERDPRGDAPGRN
ncbi:MAG: hypothetical protein MJE66_14190 [Proteobacteria bacterium]|nr:hypothetical protein [Pseudomonadota bacterium]